LVLLDTRGRWWLSLWCWLPVGGLILMVALHQRDRLGGYGAGYATGFFIFIVDGKFVLEEPRGILRDDQFRMARMDYGYSIDESRWTLELSVTAERAAGRHQEGQVLTDEESWRLVAGAPTPRIDAPQGLPGFARRDVQAWFDRNLAEMFASGETMRTTRPPPRVWAYWIVLSVCVWACAAGMILALIAWFLRGAQIGAYLRMLRRHEAGRCPRCDYDISAAPNHLCPECGCDHRAIRREAIDALRQAKRWPLEEPVPG
jgi:hypothetical protein